MENIDWNNFGIKGESRRTSFEALCEHLFCREFGATNGIRADFNQAGLETEPFEKKGFQSKYFEPTTDYLQIEKSIDLAFKKYKGRLDFVRIYLNTEAKPSESKVAARMEEKAKKQGVTIDWFTRNRFKISLSLPSNLDLAQLYFGLSDEIGFIKDGIDAGKRTLLLSKEYVPLPFFDVGGNKIEDIASTVLANNDKVCILSGHPASGKSTVMHQLFSSFAALDKTSIEEMYKTIEKNQAVPQIVNLKNCVTETLENILRNRQHDFRLPKGQKLGVIYLLDGLDELNEQRADLILSQVYEIAEKSNAAKILVSCRSGNLNRIKFFSYFKGAPEYKIGNLNIACLEQYFQAKGDKRKIQDLNRLRRVNSKLVEDVTDVLSLILFWEAADQLNENSTILDLFNIKVHKILDTPELYKNLPALNLLQPKKKAILTLNEDISFNFHYGFQPLMPLRELQELVLGKYPRIDYDDANAIIDYLASSFFDDPGESGPSFVYQHRRYQEYFFVRKLFRAYRANPKILRESGVLANNELFEGMFLKGLRGIYEEQDDMVGYLDLNLIDVYAGNHAGFGVDDPYYLESDQFIPALAAQGAVNFNRLLEDENLKLRQKLSIDPDIVKEKMEAWELDEDNYWNREYLKSTWENGLAWLIKNVARFWKADKQDFAYELIDYIVKIQDIYTKNKFLKNLKEFERPSNPYWTEYESYLYYTIVIKQESLRRILKKDILPQLERMKEGDRTVSWREDGYDKVLNSFLRVCIDTKSEELKDLVTLLDSRQRIAMLRLLFTPERLATFINSADLNEVGRECVQSFSADLDDNNYHILFYKRFFDVELTQVERTYLESKRKEILEKRTFDWRTYDYLNKFAYISYALGANTFQKELSHDTTMHHLNHFNEQVVYSALFHEWLEILRNKSTATSSVRKFIRYCEINYRDTYMGHTFKGDIARMIARILVDSTEIPPVKRTLLRRITGQEKFLAKYALYFELSKLDHQSFHRLIGKDELLPFEGELSAWSDDYPSKIDRYFELSQMLSSVDQPKSVELFSNAIVDGTLRHGWRKDTIVSYGLIEAFDVLIERNWFSKEEVRKYSKLLFEMTMRVKNITDGKGTWRGPYNLVDVLAKYDLELAKKYKDSFMEEEGRRNVSNTVVTSIILREVELGLPVETIEEDMRDFFMDYDYEHKPEASYYEQKFRVYIAIAQSDLYFDDERKTAFENAYKLIEKMKKEGVRYYLSDVDFKDEKLQYIQLCKVYDRQSNVTLEEERQLNGRRQQINEQAFRNEIEAAVTKQKIIGIYRRLDGIVLRDSESWRILIDRTYEILGHIKPFIKIMEKSSFPHTDFYSEISPYLYLGLAYALENPSTRPSIFRYLRHNTGHGGFTNLIKAYAEINDERMCRKLFGRYLVLCRLLIE